MTYVRFEIGSRIWLVPEKELSQAFREAVAKLVRASHGERLDWSAQEYDEFQRISQLREVWTL